MIITIKESNKDKAKRLLSCDDAFSLLWNIDNTLRNIIKYGSTKDATEQIQDIRTMISESRLLELYQ